MDDDDAAVNPGNDHLMRFNWFSTTVNISTLWFS
jgi:hypothetical protein